MPEKAPRVLPTAPCRIALVMAAEAELAVVLRRGPTHWVEVVLWDTRRDRFEDGPWFHGRIYEERCSLSPDGALFAYFAMKYGKVDRDAGYRSTFTAVSRPPHLTALAMWPSLGTYGGGGRFIGPRSLCMAHGANGTNHPGLGQTEIYMAPLPRPHPLHLPHGLEITTDLARYDAYAGLDLGMAPDGSRRCRDQRGRQIAMRDGILYEVGRSDQLHVIRDFNPDRPCRRPAPEFASRPL